MSSYTSDIVKPKTQIFNQQPKNLLEIDNNDDKLYNLCVSQNSTNMSRNVIKKPVAYVSPVEKINIKDQSIQTDSISIDINSIIDIHDFHRSDRLVGKLDDKNLNKPIDDVKLISAEKRIKLLEHSLGQQMKVNEDIKKLLIASLGEDLAAHFIKLTSDIAGFNEQISDLISEKIESTENIDKLSIEADLWKNKFVAGRVLVDELASWKQQLSLRYNESLGAVHSLLQERQRLRQLLTMINNELLVLSAHLNLQLPQIPLSNTLQMAQYNLTIVKTMKHKMSNGFTWRDKIANDGEYFLHFTDFTEGEEQAIEVLKNQPNPYADNTARITTSFVSEKTQCLEKIADKLCKNCKGDIFII